MAAQLSATKGRSRRGLLKWIALATSSFPVPEAPVMSTEIDEPESRRMTPNISCIGAERPTMFPQR